MSRFELAVRALARGVIRIVLTVVGAVLIGVGTLAAAVARARPRSEKPRLLWGIQPIISLVNLSRAMTRAGYPSETVAVYESSIYPGELFDQSPYRSTGNVVAQYVGNQVRPYLFFMRALRRYDVFHFFFDGGLLVRTPFSFFELPILRLLGKKIVFMPYGSDAFAFDAIANPLWRGGLMIEYALLGNWTGRVQARVRRMTKYADVVVGSVVHIACLPRWDVLPVTAYPIDVGAIDPVAPSREGPIRIVHSSNHRGAKGTDFLIAAVEELRAEGYDLELDVIERVTNTEAVARMAAADIYVDQLLFGYAMAALEAMALGKVVISGLEDTPDYTVFRRYSYLGECPIVPASPETIIPVLRDLIADRDRWPAIGEASRGYVARWHSYEAAAELYGAIYRRVWSGEDVDLINFYNPLRRPDRKAAALTSPVQ
jgi:glycosyltransferase involved in cell wall biosynthesis